MQVGISVTELNRIIGEALKKEPRIRYVTVTAEVTSFNHHLASGHWYFSLKDESSTIACVMFRQNNLRAELKPKNGDAVTVAGHVEMFGRDGRVQLYVTEMRAAGAGDLHQRFEMLKQKLAAEGLFDMGRKRVLPQIPRKVALVTSDSGKALEDVLKVSGQRCPWIPIVLVPSGVQGSAAAGEIVEALKKAASIPGVDVIILTRGGGSEEDLWCFNEENVARAVAASSVPVVTGVGHEPDVTIVDFVADVRASTPSNAAEIVFPDRQELISRARLARAELNRVMTGEVNQAMLQIHEAKNRLVRLSPERMLHQTAEKTVQFRQRLDQMIGTLVQYESVEIQSLKMILHYGINQRMNRSESELTQNRTRLEADSPLRVLERGYALVYDMNGRVLSGATSAKQINRMNIRFSDGTVTVRREVEDGGAGSAPADQL